MVGGLDLPGHGEGLSPPARRDPPVEVGVHEVRDDRHVRRFDLGKLGPHVLLRPPARMSAHTLGSTR